MVRMKSKNLIRNGSFETGDLSYWRKYPSAAIAEASGGGSMCGNYCCQMNRNDQAYVYIENTDFISVATGDVLDINYWMQMQEDARTLVYMLWYDMDQGLRSGTPLLDVTEAPSNSFQHHTVIVPPNTCYARLEFYTTINQPNYLLIDCVSVTRRTADEQPTAVVELANVQNQITKGTYECASVFSGFYYMADLVLDVINFKESGGSNPVSLYVSVQSKDHITNEWVEIVGFTEVVCGAGQTVSLYEGKEIVDGLREYLRVAYILSGDGTVGDLDFKVSAVLKR